MNLITRTKEKRTEVVKIEVLRNRELILKRRIQGHKAQNAHMCTNVPYLFQLIG